MHPTLGILARFQAFFYASAFFQSDGVPPPAPARVTQAVGRQEENASGLFEGEGVLSQPARTHCAAERNRKCPQDMTAAQSVLPGRLAHTPAPQLRRTRYAGHQSLPSHKSLSHSCAANVSFCGFKGVLPAESNCRPTQRAPDVWESARFRSIFLASSFSYISNIFHARPHAGNANR